MAAKIFELSDESTVPDVGDSLFNNFYAEVKEIERRDSNLTPKQQIDRLLRPGSTYFNLNPFEVLQVEPESSMDDVKKQYRKTEDAHSLRTIHMVPGGAKRFCSEDLAEEKSLNLIKLLSILVHPDKNPNDKDRAQKAFDIINKSYKILESDDLRAKALDVVEEAKARTNQMIEDKRKKQKKSGKDSRIEEDDPAKYKHAVYVMTMKLFADMERKRRQQEDRDMEERKRKREQEIVEEERKKLEVEWQKNYEDSRESRVNSWKAFKTGSKSKKLKEFRPPKHKAETR